LPFPVAYAIIILVVLDKLAKFMIIIMKNETR
jgi:hypothetical protein